MKKLYFVFTLSLSFVFFNNILFGQFYCNQTSDSWLPGPGANELDVNYDECNGQISFTFTAYGLSGCGDAARTGLAYFEYSIDDGTFQPLFAQRGDFEDWTFDTPTWPPNTTVPLSGTVSFFNFNTIADACGVGPNADAFWGRRYQSGMTVSYNKTTHQETIGGIVPVTISADIANTTVTWLLPPSVASADRIKIRYNIDMVGSSCSASEKQDQITPNITLQDIGTISNVQVINNNTNCNGVSLQWDNPANTVVPSCLYFHWGFRITRTNNSNGNVVTMGTGIAMYDIFGNPVSNSFTDFTAVPGQSYNYQVQTYMNFSGGTVYGPNSIGVEGTRKNTAPAPLNLNVSTSNCDASINTSWQFVNDADSYTVHWTDGTNASSASGINNSNYQITGLNSNTDYFITVTSDNNCGSSPPSVQETGFSFAEPTSPNDVTLSQDTSGNIVINWSDVLYENQYRIFKSVNGVQGLTINLPADDTTYTDVDVDPCVEYAYELRAYNSCNTNGVLGNSVIGQFNADISNTFGTAPVQGSKGYFTNRVEITWGLQANGVFIDGYNVYRRILGSGTPFSLLNTVNNPNSNIYLDYLADAGVLYEYQLVAYGECNNTIIYSDTASTIGFRASSGIINGEVNYTGGIAVEGVKVLVENVSGTNGYGFDFNGGNTATNAQPSFATDSFSAFTAEGWLKLDGIPTGTWELISDCNGVNAFSLGGDNSNYIVTLADNSGNTTTASIAIPLSSINNYNHLAFTFTGASSLGANDGVLTVYLNGAEIANQTTNIQYLQPNSICLANNLSGNLDEVKLWKEAKDSTEMFLFHSVKSNGSEANLIAFWNLDENTGNFAYDQAHQGNLYFKNDIPLSGMGTWTNDVPSPGQLISAGYTNSSGDYFIQVPYSGVGQNFTVTPIFQTHQFNPGNRVLFIGDNSTIQNNINFEDISSFPVNGSVRYKETACFVEGASVLVDGSLVVDANNAPVVTDVNGEFNIQVPIGNHFITVEKNGHVFNEGRFPPNSGTFDFQAPVTGLEFEDSTRIKVIGRVAGGLREAGKLPGLGQGVNNIGVTRVIFNTTCHADTIFTDSLTGEYVAYVLPFEHNIDLFVPSSGLRSGVAGQGFGILDFVDLSIVPSVQSIYDTISFDTLTQTYLIDSVDFQKQLDYIYRVDPQIDVFSYDYLGLNLIPFRGDSVVEFTDYITGDSTYTVPASLFPYDVFTEFHSDEDFKYKAQILTYELYTNTDLAPAMVKLDSVPVSDGKLIFDNELSGVGVNTIALSDVITDINELSYVLHEFAPGKPNFIANLSVPEYSYTRRLYIALERPDGTVIPWLPITNPVTNQPDVYRAYLLGAQSTGTNFFTEGPESVDYVLRDPPGAESFAERSAGNVISSLDTWSWALGLDSEKADDMHVGAAYTTGLGISIETDIETNNSVGISSSKKGGRSGSLSRTIENTSTWRTNPNPTSIGSKSDLYVGKSTNVEFGISDFLKIIPDTMCSPLEKLRVLGNGYCICQKSSLSIAPGGYNTAFIYTQEFIETSLLPTLKNLRDIYLASPKYSSVLPVGDPNYGKNNDDPVFGANVSSLDPTIMDIPDDYAGVSYVYTPGPNLQDTIVDSLRLLNQQINLWEDAIALNEFEKVNINNSLVLDSMRIYEITKLEAKYQATNDAYQALQIANGALAIGAFVANKVNPLPGSAISESAVFAVTTGTKIAAKELEQKHLEYIDKRDAINDKFANIVAVNQSISGGSSFTSSTTSTVSATRATTFEFGSAVTFASSIKAKISNVGYSVDKSLSVNFENSSAHETTTDQSATVSYTLSDPDVLDFFSVDVYPSLFGWGPIFKRQSGGASGCPYEGEEVTAYYEPGTVISAATLQRDLPGISVSQPVITNIPIDQPAVFTLTISNLTQTGDDQSYIVKSIASQNPLGAIITINGAASQTPLVPAGSAINLTLAVEKGPGATYSYDSLLIVVQSICEDEIVDSVWISADFIPTCTDIELINPQDNWILNNSFNDTLPVIVGGYNVNFFDLERYRIEYKASNNPAWIGLQSYWSDTTGQPTFLPIPTVANITNYDWAVDQIPDGNYDLRVSSLCTQAIVSSQVYSGVMDRINPHPFGTPVPGDGILDTNEDILIRFNEPVDLGSLTSLNFDVRGVLNETIITNATSLFFDGVDDEILISGGANIQNRDFTIEFWAKRDAFGQQTIFSQGSDVMENLSIGFNAANLISFNINGEEILSANPVIDNNWHHYAFAYNFDNETVEMYYDATLANPGNLTIFSDYTANDVLYLGKNSIFNADFFSGNLHEVRVWNKYRTLSDIAPSINIGLSAGTIGLLYNWKMDEATGQFVEDHIRQRNGVINGPTWQVTPVGSAYEFDGVDDYLEVANTGNVAITDEMDFTLEFWYNSSNPNSGTMISNGSGTGLLADSLTSWTIEKDAAGIIHVKHNGLDFIASNQNTFDGAWHHFALILQRTGNLSAYIDGNLQNSIQGSTVDQFGGGTIFLGARGFFTGLTPTIDQHFNGLIDEFRFWNTARKVEQLSRDKQNRLVGDELGLLAYLPMEDYQVVLGFPVLTPSLIDVADVTHIATGINGADFTVNTPTIKLPRPVQSIPHTYSVNNDEIIITPTISPELIENVTLDITVGGVRDLNGNVMQSPETWIAFMDKNQVIWQDDLLTFDKDFGASLTFSSAVVNNGGSAQVFTIENLPSWLTASQTTGSIAPQAVQVINFTVDPSVNIGDYTEDIHLLTSFGFPEKLSLNLKVREEAPDWTVNPADYNYSMSIIGLLEIESIISRDDEDILGVFVNNQARGAAHLQYVPSVDQYLVFLDAYSNVTSGENLTFKIWDASTGGTYVDVIPNLVFNANDLIGSVLNPQLFQAGNVVTQEIPIVQGWNWIGFNLLTTDSSNLDTLMMSYTPDPMDELKGQTAFANYSSGVWNGTLANNGVEMDQGYRLRATQADLLTLYGSIVDPTTRNINFVPGWNWVGFISVRNQSVAQALGNLTPTDGDLIKGKSQFAVYDNNLGWIGSLQTLIPGQSYMYQAANAAAFTFPFAGAFKNGNATQEEIIDDRWQVNHPAFASNMTQILSLDFCNLTLEDLGELEDWYVGVFDENQICRGLSEWTSLHNGLRSFMTVSGSTGEKLSFKLLHKPTGVAITTINDFTYQSNALKGSLFAPIVIELSEEDCAKLANDIKPDLSNEFFSVYPNVFSESVSVKYRSSMAEEAKVNIYNSIGQLVFSTKVKLQVGMNTFTLDMKQAQLFRGAYFLELSSEGQATERTKIIQK